MHLPPPNQKYGLASYLALAFALLGLTLRLTPSVEAQSSPPLVTVVEVDSRDYPQIAVTLAVSDANGPIEALTAAAYQITTDWTPVPGSVVSLEPEELQSLRLVLAIDVTVPPEALAEIKVAAKSLIDTLALKDKLAVISFGNEIKVEYDYTNNTTELHRVIDTLTPGGDRTALYSALAQAGELSSQLPKGGRQAIIALTDNKDNVGGVSPAVAIAPAHEAGVPVYVIGFGEKAQPLSPFNALLQESGGDYVVLSDPSQVTATLGQIEQSLRTGYRLTFLSQLEADDTWHEMVINLDYQGQGAQAISRFKATAREIKVGLTGVAEGQVATGLVNLAPEVVTTGSVTSIKYWLDNQLLAERNESPFTFDWDTSQIRPGPHALRVEVVDNVGNSGRATVNLTIASPLKVEVAPGQNKVVIGDRLTLRTSIEAAAPLTKVDLLVNGTLLDTRNEPPFSFPFDTSRYDPGLYQVTVRAQDSLGQVGQATIALDFQPAPPPAPGLISRILNDTRVRSGLIVALALLGVVATIFAAGLLLRLRAWLEQRRARQMVRFEIANVGNVPSRYRLRAKDAAGTMQFQFVANGRKLAESWQPEPSLSEGARLESAAQPGQSAPAPQSAAVPTTTVSMAAPAPGTPQAGGLKQGFSKTMAAEAQAQGCLATIAGLFATIGSLLPGPMGTSLRQLSDRLYGQQRIVERAKLAPTQTLRTAGHLRQQVAGVAANRAGQGDQSGARQQPHVVSNTSRPRPNPESPTHSPAPVIGPTMAGRLQGSSPVVGNGWYQTPLVEPNDSLLIELTILPEKRYQAQSCRFTILSQSLEQPGLPLISDEAVAQFAGISRLWRWLPVSIIVLASLGTVGTIVALTTWRLTAVSILSLLFVL